ncbi:MAG: outer membrane beta-barrel protein [bacterium]
MSRKLLTVAAFAALALPATSAHAQLGFGVAAGPSAALSDFGKVVDAGYHVTGIATVSIPLAPIGFRLEGSFSEFNYKGAVSGSTDAKARIISGTANAVLSSPGILGPYFIAGLGLYNASAQCTGCSTSSNKVGFNGGGGFKFGLGSLAVFAEARYHYIPGASDATNGGVKSSTQFIPVSVGITF